MPTYRGPFRAAYCHDPIWNFDGCCVVRNQPGADFPEFALDEVSYIIADCLVGKALDCGGRRRFGAFLPSQEDAVISDVELRSWLDGAAVEEDSQTVTLVALGSQSALEVVCEHAEVRLLEGCLRASPRVLAASKSDPEQMSPLLLEAVRCGRLRFAQCLPQWAVLNHPSVRCFVSSACSYQQDSRRACLTQSSTGSWSSDANWPRSHGGANSTHEALASGVAVVPLPFFDDQTLGKRHCTKRWQEKHVDCRTPFGTAFGPEVLHRKPLGGPNCRLQ